MIDLLTKAEALLARAGLADWAAAMARANAVAHDDVAEGAIVVRSMFGGMGSLSDLVLHDSDGNPVAEDNRAFDEMRQRLYELSISTRSSSA